MPALPSPLAGGGGAVRLRGMTDTPEVPKIPWHIRVQSLVLRRIGHAIMWTVYRVRVVNAERLPRTGGVLLLPNHVTFADAFFISAACPRPVRFVMDDSVLRFAPVRWFCSVFNTINIRRGQSRDAIRKTVEAVKQGDVVCFFPEGQLSRTGALNELKRGIEMISKHIDAPLVPLWIDGAWGSVFSFERDRFFGKRPYRLPHDEFASFGERIGPDEVSTAVIRDRLLRASAEALALRFGGGATAEEINGYQIGQVNALRWRTRFGVWRDDPLRDRLPALFDGFSQAFGSLCMVDGEMDGKVRSWVGGEAGRRWLESREPEEEIDFYEFADGELPVWTGSGKVRHFPCLAVGGMVVAMSMPDPAVPGSGTFQPGGKPGTWGKLLPGWFVEDGLAKGPAAAEGVRLPEGAFLDGEGFLAQG